MAIAVQLPSQTIPTSWGTAISNSYNQELIGSMTVIMSYQYPPPPQDGAEMDLPHSSYLSSYPTSVTSSMEGTNDSDHGFAGEKRRNKLGYHRTSVACGHCRHRKIRCIPHQDDIQRRCVTCIRLKKECSFFPVDQQPPPTAGQKPGKRSSLGPKIASASTSPAITTGHPSDMQSHQNYPNLNAMSSIQNMGPPAIKQPEPYPADPKIPSSASSTRTFDYGQGVSNWMATDASPSSTKGPGDINTTWRPYPHESPLTPAFSPYTPHAPPPSATWPSAPLGTPVGSEGSSRAEEVAWSPYPAPPARSLSYGGEHSHPYPPMSHVGVPSSSRSSYGRKSSMTTDMYPPPITTSIPNIESIPGTTIDPHGSLSAGAVPSASYGTWQQPYSYSKSGDGYGGWYESGGNSDGQAPSGGDPSHSGGMYYQGRGP